MHFSFFPNKRGDAFRFLINELKKIDFRDIGKKEKPQLDIRYLQIPMSKI